MNLHLGRRGDFYARVMSIYSSMQMATNTLRATQIGLQVVGQNIANANTDGYIREEAIFEPGPIQRDGNLVLGLGVKVGGIIQRVDSFIQERLFGSRSDRAGAEVEEQAYQQVETILSELTDSDLSTAMSDLFASIAEVLNQPESVAIRNLVILRGQTVTSRINGLSKRLLDLRKDLNTLTAALEGEINTLTDTIRTLNVRITTTEGGELATSDAGALRDQRNAAVDRLAEIMDIQISEQPSGALNVSVDGEYLVFESRRRLVSTNKTSEDGVILDTIQFDETKSPLNVTSGELAGLYESRDTVVKGLFDQLDEFARTLVFEFNKLYSRGQGLTGYEEVTAEFPVDDPDLELDAAGLPFTPTSGSLDVLLHNVDSGLHTTHTILINLDGIDLDTTLNDVASAIDAIDGLSSSITSTGELTVSSDSADLTFAFAGDTSGLLASLGINTFFSGTNAGNLGIKDYLEADAGKFAASAEGIAEDTKNGVDLAGFMERPLEAAGGELITDVYDQIVNNVAQGSAVATAVKDGFITFEQTLEGAHDAVSGVNLDEEAVKLLALQRLYQVSARYIKELSDLLDILVNL